MNAVTKRVITAISIILFVGLGLFLLPGWVYAAVVILLIVGGLNEFYGLIEKKGIFIYKYFGIFVGVLIPLTIYFRFEPTKGWELLFIVTATLIFFVLQFLRKDSSQAIVGISTTLFGIFYVSWFMSFLIKIRFLLPDGILLATFLLLVTKMGDVGAYLVGKSMGKNTLILRISPKKTLEGSMGGLFFSISAALISKLYLPFIPILHLLAMGVLLGFLAQLGDLCESLIKRDCQVKDSGSHLPGMGGILDVIDSIIFATPIFYYYLLYFKLVTLIP